ncbi:hypothetical protein MTO96_008162 [Rhipicephalus appendiculatus]
MDLGRHVVNKRQLSEDGNEETQEYQRINLCLVVVLVVGMGLFCFLFVLGFMSSNQTDGDPTTVDTLPSLSFTGISVPGVTRRSEQPRPHGTNSSTTSPQDPHNVPTPLEPLYECSTCRCRTLGTQIREKLDYSVDPCTDFYKFVCNSFRGHNEFANTRDSVKLFTLLRLIVPYIPESDQLSWQKAAGMYQACMNFASSYEPETKYLVEWLVSLDLDLLNETRLAKVNPVRMMVRGSLDLGVRAVIAIFLSPKAFLDKKRVMQLAYIDDKYSWKSHKRDVDEYAKFMLLYGAKPPLDKQLAEKISRYDDELDLIASGTVTERIFRPIAVYDLGNLTEPFVTSDDWALYISDYTNGTYTSSDYIYCKVHALQVLFQVFNTMAQEAPRYLVAWKFYWTLKRHGSGGAQPFLPIGDSAKHGSRGEGYMVDAIRYSFVKALQSSTWLSSEFREAAVKKLTKMVAHVGSPGRRLEPDFVEAVYKPYPDAPLDLDVLFPTWIKALGLSSHYMWTDTTTPLYDETAPYPYYMYAFNDFTIPTVAMLRPFFYLYGIYALNYGGLGTMIGHEIMHAYGPYGLSYLEGYEPHDTDDVIKEYTKRALCLRRSHKSLLSLGDQEGRLNGVLDSENLADLVGTKVAYDAFNSLASGHRELYLGGLNMSAQQLFFLNHCVKVCSQKEH